MALTRLHPRKVEKDPYGSWSVEENFAFPDGSGRVLHVLTMKRFGGDFVTRARAQTPQDGGFFMVYSPMDDFSVEVARTRMRGTAKAVVAWHEAVFPEACVERLMEQAVAHYAAKAAGGK